MVGDAVVPSLDGGVCLVLGRRGGAAEFGVVGVVVAVVGVVGGGRWGEARGVAVADDHLGLLVVVDGEGCGMWFG